MPSALAKLFHGVTIVRNVFLLKAKAEVLT